MPTCLSHLGASPYTCPASRLRALFTVIPASRQIYPELWRLTISFLNCSASHRTLGYQLCSTGVLPQLVYFYWRPVALHLLQAAPSRILHHH